VAHAQHLARRRLLPQVGLAHARRDRCFAAAQSGTINAAEVTPPSETAPAATSCPAVQVQPHGRWLRRGTQTTGSVVKAGGGAARWQPRHRAHRPLRRRQNAGDAWRAKGEPSPEQAYDSAASPRNRSGSRGRRGGLGRRRRRRRLLLGARGKHCRRSQDSGHRNLAEQRLAGHYLHVRVHRADPYSFNVHRHHNTTVIACVVSNRWLHDAQRLRR
jgi:hypothetical protein